MSAAVLAASGGYAVNGRFSGDVYRHAATVDRLATSITHPSNPIILGDAPDPGFSPYAVVLGMISRLTGLDGIDLLPWVGLALMVLLLALWPGAIATLVGDARAAPIALLLTLLAWGIQPWRWSGYLSLNSFGFGLGYPSLAAWCALLGGVIVAGRDPGGRDVATAALLGLIVAFIALTHPITLVGALPLIVGVLLRNETTARGVVTGIGAIVIAGALVAAWPLFSFLDLLDAGGGAYDSSNRATYARWPLRTFLALPGLVIVARRAIRSLPDPLVLSTATGLAVFGAGFATERWTGGRSVPFVLLACHVALAGWIVDRAVDPRATQRARRRLALATASICTVGVVGCAAGAVAAIPRAVLPEDLADDRRLQSEASSFDFLRSHGRPDAVLVASDRDAARAALAYGFTTVHAPYPMPALDRSDATERDSARQAYLYGDRTLRAALVDRYGITHVLVRTGERIDLRGHLAVAEGSGFVLYTIPFQRRAGDALN